MTTLDLEIAQAAAALVVDEGLDYGPAKQRALKVLGLPARTPLPDNDAVESAVREHLALFCADTQPAELRALREHALVWMGRLARFEPLLGGAVWHGTATALSDIYLQLFADDAKEVEIELINQGQSYQASLVKGLHGHTVEALSLHSLCPGLGRGRGEEVGVHVLVNPSVAMRGALLPDAQGRKPRGNAADVRARLSEDNASFEGDGG